MCVNGIPATEVILDSAATIMEMPSVEREQLLQCYGSCTGKESNPPTLLAHSCWGINVCKLFCVNSLTQTSQISKVPIMNMRYLNTESLCRNPITIRKLQYIFLNTGIR